MAGTFPNLASGQVCLYPVTRTLTVPTRVLQFANDKEQRWKCGSTLNAWALEYRSLTAADVATLRAFFDTQKGAFDKSWSFPFDGTTYTSMVFNQDEFSITEEVSPVKRYALSLKLKQVKRSGTYASGLPAVFPAIAAGIVTQLPFTSTARYNTIQSEMDSGQVYSYAMRNTPCANWSLTFSAITNAEMLILFDFFVAMGGQLATFSFTDPISGIPYSNCRFAQDRLEVKFVSKAVRNLTLQLQEFAV